MTRDLVEQNYLLWERQTDPERARVRLFAAKEPRVCAVRPDDLKHDNDAAQHDRAAPAGRA